MYLFFIVMCTLDVLLIKATYLLTYLNFWLQLCFEHITEDRSSPTSPICPPKYAATSVLYFIFIYLKLSVYTYKAVGNRHKHTNTHESNTPRPNGTKGR